MKHENRHEQLIIVGAGGHGRVVADIARLLHRYELIAFVDDDTEQQVDPYPILGTTDSLSKLIGISDMVIATGNNAQRRLFTARLETMGASLATLAHPSAVLAEDVRIGSGTVIMANAVVNCASVVGKGVIINTAATIDHDNVIGDFVHVSPGAHLAGMVTIGRETWIGIGASVIQQVNICSDCIVGAGAVVVRDIVKSGTYIGVPAHQQTTENSRREKYSL